MISMSDLKLVKIRDDIHLLLNKMKAKKIAEIGVREGVHLQELLKCHTIEEAVGIDIWDLWSETKIPGQNDDNSSIELLSCRYDKMKIMESNDLRIKLIKDFSVKAISSFPDEYFDFIYIDADHSEAAVYKDIKASWSKVKSGGILAGHDFHLAWKGVIASVKRFAKENNVEFYVDSEIDWFIIKP